MNMHYMRDFIKIFPRAPRDTNWYSNDSRQAEEIDPNSSMPVVGGLHLDTDAITYLRRRVFFL